MTTKEAVAQRIIDLCAERNIAVNALANISGVAHLRSRAVNHIQYAEHQKPESRSGFHQKNMRWAGNNRSTVF